MKKLSAVFLAFLMLFLCSCSDGNPVATPSDAENITTPESVTEKYNVITEWGTDLLPEKFPSPPKGTHDFSIVKGEGVSEAFAYSTDFYRITFICPEQEFYSFSNEMISLGYKGGAKSIKNGTYYTDGFSGYWQNGETYVRISDSTATDSGEIIFQIDIAQCVDNFPSALEEYFPKFNGYCMSIGSFCGHDGNGEQITDEFEGSFAMPAWHWEFRFSNGFVGVERAEFEEYFFEIEAEGFEGILSTSTVDGFTVMSGDLTKDNYGVFMLYNTNLKTLDIAYTNDTSIYFD
ncbi:MAG: hypothetical protein IJE74_05545 [Clostridia bacterium]|nr:hypothetical protein [Clostridia bacterium]